MYPDVQYITLVRDATSWFESAVKFWPVQVQEKVNIVTWPDASIENAHSYIPLELEKLSTHVA